MKTILAGTSRRVGAIFNELDTNFVEVCNSILRIAYPDKTLKGLAETEPASPTTGDCYLVTEDATIWGIAAVKDDILHYNGAAWELLDYKITEINGARYASDSHILLGNYSYHDQAIDADTAGDWRQYTDVNGFYTQYCTVGNATKGAGTWVTKQTIAV